MAEGKSGGGAKHFSSLTGQKRGRAQAPHPVRRLLHPLIGPNFEIGVTVVPWHCFSWEITPHENDLDNKETFNHLSVYNAWDV